MWDSNLRKEFNPDTKKDDGFNWNPFSKKKEEPVKKVEVPWFMVPVTKAGW